MPPVQSFSSGGRRSRRNISETEDSGGAPIRVEDAEDYDTEVYDIHTNGRMQLPNPR
mgnify:CR=1 FL=1